jgi:hypothetical protein
MGCQVAMTCRATASRSPQPRWSCFPMARQSDLGAAARRRRHQDRLRMVIRLGCSLVIVLIIVRLRAGWR